MYEDPDGVRIERRKTKDRRKGVETNRTRKVLVDSNIFMLWGPRAVFQHGKDDVVIKAEVREELNHSKKEKRKIGENTRNTNAFITSALEGKSEEEIRNGIPLSSLAHLVFGTSVRVQVGGLLFIEMDEPENEAVLFSNEFKIASITSVTVKLENGEEMTIPVSKDVGQRLKKAFRDMNDKAILSSARAMKKRGEAVLLVTNDKKLRADAHLEGILAKDYIEEVELTQKKARNRPGRKTSQRSASWN